MAIDSLLGNALNSNKANTQAYVKECLKNLEHLKATCKKEQTKKERQIESEEKQIADTLKQRTKNLKQEGWNAKEIDYFISGSRESYAKHMLKPLNEDLENIKGYIDVINKVIAVFNGYHEQ